MVDGDGDDGEGREREKLCRREGHMRWQRGRKASIYSLERRSRGKDNGDGGEWDARRPEGNRYSDDSGDSEC